jgi:hypothetical protein
MLGGGLSATQFGPCSPIAASRSAYGRRLRGKSISSSNAGYRCEKPASGSCSRSRKQEPALATASVAEGFEASPFGAKSEDYGSRASILRGGR